MPLLSSTEYLSTKVETNKNGYADSANEMYIYISRIEKQHDAFSMDSVTLVWRTLEILATLRE